MQTTITNSWKAYNPRSSRFLLALGLAILMLFGLALMTSCGGGASAAGGPAGTPASGNNGGSGDRSSSTFFSTAPASLNFGTVAVGQTVALNLTITNSGQTSHTIESDSMTSSAFQITGLAMPMTLSTGQSASFTVAFTPNTQAQTSTTLTLATDVSGVSVSVPLQGTGGDGELLASQDKIGFGNVMMGQSASQSISVTNSGTMAVQISSVTVTGTGFSASGLQSSQTILPGTSASLTAKFSAGTIGNAAGSISIASDDPKSPMLISLAGNGIAAPEPNLAANPPNLAFGAVSEGGSGTLAITLTNEGTAALVISSAEISGGPFTLNGLSLPVSLNSGQSTAASVVFAPQTAGTFSGTLTIGSNDPASPTVVPLSGTGTAPVRQLSVNPSSLTFTDIVVGTNSTQSFTMTNTGNASLTISAVAALGTGFSVNGVSLPMTLAANQSAGVNVVFAPQSTGTFSGSITITSNADNSPATVALSGTAVQSDPHMADLAWTASAGTVAGYNVYRGAQAGGPYTKMNSSLVISTAFTDLTVQGGTTYFYVVTAVDNLGNESAYGNEAIAVIPQ